MVAYVARYVCCNNVDRLFFMLFTELAKTIIPENYRNQYIMVVILDFTCKSFVSRSFSPHAPFVRIVEFMPMIKDTFKIKGGSVKETKEEVPALCSF